MKSIQPGYRRPALRLCFRGAVSAFCTVLFCGVGHVNALPPAPLVTVVDIIPASLSKETDTNSEPNLAVNPAHPLQIAASAYLPDPMGGKTSSILVSTNGGMTWTCRSTVPTKKMACDVTLRFGGLFNMLYLAALNDYWTFVICRSNNLATLPMDTPIRQPGSGIDQPYVAAATIAGQDRVFVGANDWYSSTASTATVVRSVNGTASLPTCNFTPVPIEFVVPPALRDDPEVRAAVSADGKKVYAVFNRLNSITGNTRVGDVILVRDDDGGNSGAASFKALGATGHSVISGRTFLFDPLLGGDRLGGDLAIAVDPRNADNVYLVWGDVSGNQPLLHVIRSKDGGQTWLPTLHTVNNAKNPGLAINNRGTLAFIYQQVVTNPMGQQTWFTNVELTKDDFLNVNPLTLAKFPAAEINSILGQPRLGDYLHLMALENTFYGIFSASNVPDPARFPLGVIFQRYKNFATKKLLDQHGHEVPSSVDPFFFKVID